MESRARRQLADPGGQFLGGMAEQAGHRALAEAMRFVDHSPEIFTESRMGRVNGSSCS